MRGWQTGSHFCSQHRITCACTNSDMSDCKFTNHSKRLLFICRPRLQDLNGAVANDIKREISWKNYVKCRTQLWRIAACYKKEVFLRRSNSEIVVRNILKWQASAAKHESAKDGWRDYPRLGNECIVRFGNYPRSEDGWIARFRNQISQVQQTTNA